MRERRAPWSSSERCVRRGLEKLCYIKETGVTFLSTLGTQYNHTNKQAWSKKKRFPQKVVVVLVDLFSITNSSSVGINILRI